MAGTLSRDVPIEPERTALPFMDVQKFGAARNGGAYADIPEAEFEDRLGYYFEGLTRDGRSHRSGSLAVQKKTPPRGRGFPG